MMSLPAVLLLAVQTASGQELTDAGFEKWRDFIRPGTDELRWSEIPWRASFWDAVAEGQQQKKPVLLWAMNGHPLACT